jgi:hypothetical protein
MKRSFFDSFCGGKYRGPHIFTHLPWPFLRGVTTSATSSLLMADPVFGRAPLSLEDSQCV